MILVIIFVLLFFCALVEVSTQKRYKTLFILLYLFVTLITVFRYGVGADYPGYYIAFNEVPALDDGFIFGRVDAHGEPVYHLLVAIFKYFGYTFRELAMLISIVTMYLFYLYFKKFCNYSLISLFIFFAIYYVVYPFNVIRQGLTIAFFVGVLLPLLLDKRYKLFYLLTILGALFHYSLLIVLICPILCKLKFSKKILILFIVIFFFLPIERLFSPLINSVPYLSVYSDTSSNLLPLLNRLLLFIPIMWMYDKNQDDSYTNKIIFLSVISFILFINFSSYSLISSRLNVYFKSVELSLLPVFFANFKIKSNRIIYFLLLSVILSILFIKSLNTDLYYLKMYQNIPESFGIFDYPIINNFFNY